MRFTTSLGAIFDLGMCVTLVCMPEPSGALLLAAHQCDPFTATSAETFPHVEVALRPPRLLRALKRSASGGADTMRERLVVPKSAVLEHEPPSRFAQTTPALALVPMPTHPAGGIEIADKSKVLLMGNEIWI